MGRCPPRSSLCFIWPEGSPTDFVTKKTLCCLWSLENQFYCNRNNWLGHSSTSTITPRRFYLSRTRNKVSLTPLLPGSPPPVSPHVVLTLSLLILGSSKQLPGRPSLSAALARLSRAAPVVAAGDSVAHPSPQASFSGSTSHHSSSRALCLREEPVYMEIQFPGC